MAANKAIRRLARRINELKEENLELSGEIEVLNCQISEMGEMAHRREGKLRCSLENERREREEDESRSRYREYDRRDAVKELEKAREWGDSWREEKALRNLKSL